MEVGNPDASSTSSEGVELFKEGLVASYVSADGNSAIVVKRGNTVNARVKGDGSAEFASGEFVISSTGNLAINRTSGTNDILNGKLNGSVTSTINADGSATFAGQIISGDGTSTDGNLVINRIGETNSQKFMRLASAGSEKVAVYADGSATFAGQITAGADAFATANTGSGLTTTGSVIARRSGTGSVWLGYQTGTAVQTSTIKADGSATFAGDVTMTSSALSGYSKIYKQGLVQVQASYTTTELWRGNNINATQTSVINADGSATFAGGDFAVTASGTVQVKNPTSNADAIQIYSGGSSVTTRLNENGSATFAGGYGSSGVSITSDGEVRADSQITSNRSSGVCFSAQQGGSQKASISADGTASFNSHITVNGGINTGSTTNYGSVRYGGGEYYAQTASSSAGTTDMIRIYYGTAVNTRLRANGQAVFSDRVQAGNSSGQYGFLAYAGTSGSNYTCYYAKNYASGGRLFYGEAHNSATARVNIYENGNAGFSGNVTAANISDIKFKENITDAKPQLSDVVALGSILRNWDWKEETPLNEELRARRFLGLVAQEAEVICPGITYDVKNFTKGEELTPETTDEEGNIIPATYEDVEYTYKAINHDILVMKLLGAVAELKAEIEALKAG